MSCYEYTNFLIRQLPLITPATQNKSPNAEDYPLLRQRHIIVAVAAALLFVVAWVKALSLPLSACVILSAAVGAILWDRKRAVNDADAVAAYVVLWAADFQTHLPRIHTRLEAAKLFVASPPDALLTVKQSPAKSKQILSCTANIEVFKCLIDAGFAVHRDTFLEALNRAETEPEYIRCIFDKHPDIAKQFTPEWQHFFWLNIYNKSAAELLSKHGFDVNSRNHNQRTPLQVHFMCLEGEKSFKLAKTLLEVGANPFDVKYDDMDKLRAAHPEMVKLIEHAQADPQYERLKTRIAAEFFERHKVYIDFKNAFPSEFQRFIDAVIKLKKDHPIPQALIDQLESDFKIFKDKDLTKKARDLMGAYPQTLFTLHLSPTDKGPASQEYSLFMEQLTRFTQP
jgi:hypothetical protein